MLKEQDVDFKDESVPISPLNPGSYCRSLFMPLHMNTTTLSPTFRGVCLYQVSS